MNREARALVRGVIATRDMVAMTINNNVMADRILAQVAAGVIPRLEQIVECRQALRRANESARAFLNTLKEIEQYDD